MTAGGWIWAAMVRVVVMSIIALRAGRRSIVAGWGLAARGAATAPPPISPCSTVARARPPVAPALPSQPRGAGEPPLRRRDVRQLAIGVEPRLDVPAELVPERRLRLM